MAGRVMPLPGSSRTHAKATAALLDQPDLADSTRRSYDRTLAQLVTSVDPDPIDAEWGAMERTPYVARMAWRSGTSLHENT